MRMIIMLPGCLLIGAMFFGTSRLLINLESRLQQVRDEPVDDHVERSARTLGQMLRSQSKGTFSRAEVQCLAMKIAAKYDKGEDWIQEFIRGYESGRSPNLPALRID